MILMEVVFRDIVVLILEVDKVADEVIADYPAMPFIFVR